MLPTHATRVYHCTTHEHPNTWLHPPPTHTYQGKRKEAGEHDINDPTSQWSGFLDNINLSRDRKYTDVAEALSQVYGDRIPNMRGPFQQLVLSATVVSFGVLTGLTVQGLSMHICRDVFQNSTQVTEFVCTAGPCLKMLK